MYSSQKRSNSTEADRKQTSPAQIPTQKKDCQQNDENKSRTSNHRKEFVTLGICAMKKKVQSKPMKEILSRISNSKEIKIIQMWQYLESSYESWPKVDALICFYSDGFPFAQAWRYVKKNKPFLINSLDKQQLLWDRTVVYDLLKKIRVPVARHFMIFRDKNYIDQLELRGNGPIFDQNEEQDDNKNSLPKIMRKHTETRNSEHKINISKNDSSNSHNSQIRNNSDNNNQHHCNFHNSQPQNHISSSEHHVPILIKGPSNESLSDNKIASPFQKFNGENQQKYKASSIDKDKLKKLQRSTSLKRQAQEEGSQGIRQSRKQRKSPRNQDDRSLSKNSFTFRKRTQIGMIEPNRSPSALRSFHEKRIKDIDDYSVQEIDDGLLIKSKKSEKVHKLKKPFVQKPFDSQNHNICIYYPQSMGGGRKMLFRKVKNKSSEYQPNENSIRTDRNYIYEEYLQTNAFDIKVYTIGPYYMYAEARRSPTLDGVVDRDQTGKEKRFPVILTPQQKFLCSKIVQQFEQDICGFDLLRAQGKSYVCDVNGWSFVKGNPKYWDDCAIILRRKILKRFFPHLLNSQNSKYQRFLNNQKNQYRPPINRLSVKNEQLRSIVSIFRHGDRSPKLKMKIKTKDQRFLEFFKNTKKDKNQIKLKDAKSLTKILNITNEIIVQIGDIMKPQFKDYNQMKVVLESGGGFEGFNRKLQMKVLQRDHQPDQEGNYPVRKVLVVLKWGGQLSYLGFADAMDLGMKMRQERYDDDHDFLSLYSSYKHDLKTYSSDQGRCIKTAAAFLKGFLNISGGLAPIITSMVNFTKKAQSNYLIIIGIELLDCSSEQSHSIFIESIQQTLTKIMNTNELLYNNYLKYVREEEISPAMKEIIMQIGNPIEKLEKVLFNQLQKMNELICQLVEILQELEFQNWFHVPELGVESHQDQYVFLFNIYRSPQSLIIIFKRWSKLQKDLYNSETKKFNISKIPQIYDNIRYDLKKNHCIFSSLDFNIHELQSLAKLLAYFIVPNEYGLNDKQKLTTAKQIVSPLMEKILVDLMFWKNKKYEDLFWKYKQSTEQDYWKHIRTRLYFTSASHMYSIINVICLGNNRELLKSTPPEEAEKAINQLYMSYLSHIEFRLYENMVAQEDDSHRFRLQISISSEYKKTKPLKQFFLGGSQGFTIDKIQKFFESILAQKQAQMQKKVDQLVDENAF